MPVLAPAATRVLGTFVGTTLLGVLALAGMASTARAAGSSAEPRAEALYEDGPGGLHLLDGRWLYRADPEDAGLVRGFHIRRTATGWRPVVVPNAFNAGDFSQSSFDGAVGWYRKDFTAPDLERGVGWTLRFESVNYRARVWLNGRPLGGHEGAYLPFELPARGVKQRGVNRLVVRVDSRRSNADVPPQRALWWNWGGILREVYLRRVGALDLQNVRVIPELRDRNQRARVTVAVRLLNATGRRRGGLRGLMLGPGLGEGRPVRFSPRRVPARSSRPYEAALTLERPRLWWPERPRLYRLRLEAGPAGSPDQTYSTHFGVRSFVTDGLGRALLNGRPLQLRGAGMHEDSLATGAALGAGQRAASIRHLKELNANFTRAHYPLHPRTLELCDREGIVVWDQIPFYHLYAGEVDETLRRKGLTQLREMIARDRNHASVMAYSIGNELGGLDAGLETYIRRAARLSRHADPSRLVTLDIGFAGAEPREPVYGELDALGVNQYFGWYFATSAEFGPNLDALRRVYPDLALFITEFGAEANRPGAIDDKGTYAFQADYLRYHLDAMAQRPYLGGALIWALREFAVAPGWEGGNPSPSPPFHTKGLVGLRGKRKPAFDQVAELFGRTPATRRR